MYIHMFDDIKRFALHIVVFVVFGLNGNLIWDWQTMIFERTTFELESLCFSTAILDTLIVFKKIVISWETFNTIEKNPPAWHLTQKSPSHNCSSFSRGSLCF